MLVNSLNFENNQQHSVSLKLNNCGTKNSFVKSAKVNLRNSPADKFIKHFKDFIRRFEIELFDLYFNFVTQTKRSTYILSF